MEELPPAGGADPQAERWFRVELHAERLDWLPPLLASLDRPFVVERPDELRDLLAALADRLATSARRNAPHQHRRPEIKDGWSLPTRGLRA